MTPANLLFQTLFELDKVYDVSSTVRALGDCSNYPTFTWEAFRQQCDNAATFDHVPTLFNHTLRAFLTTLLSGLNLEDESLSDHFKAACESCQNMDSDEVDYFFKNMLLENYNLDSNENIITAAVICHNYYSPYKFLGTATTH